MSLEKLTESSCVACREDAPLVTQEEIEELKPQIPAWEIQKINGICLLYTSPSPRDRG